MASSDETGGAQSIGQQPVFSSDSSKVLYATSVGLRTVSVSNGTITTLLTNTSTASTSRETDWKR